MWLRWTFHHNVNNFNVQQNNEEILCVINQFDILYFMQVLYEF